MQKAFCIPCLPERQVCVDASWRLCEKCIRLFNKNYYEMSHPAYRGPKGDDNF